MQFKSPSPHVQSKPKRSTSQFKSPGSTKRSNISAPAAQTKPPTLMAMPRQSRTIIKQPTLSVEPQAIIKQPIIPVQSRTIIKQPTLSVEPQAIIKQPTIPAQLQTVIELPTMLLSAKTQTQAPMPSARAVTQSPSVSFRVFAICLSSIAVCVNGSNYGPLIPAINSALRIDKGQIGLFSTLFFLGIIVSNVPGGILADRFGSRPVMLVGLFLTTAGALLFPVFPDFFWMVACRALIGVGSGAALVSCSQACAQLGKYEPMGQGLRGGAAQLGAGLGVVLMALLQGPLGWRNALFVCGILGVVALIVWLWYPQKVHSAHRGERPAERPALAIRTPAVWMLGLANMGTLGLTYVLAAWLSIYFTNLYGLSLAFAGALSSAALFGGVFFQTLGGLLLARWQKPVLLMCIGTVMCFLSVVALALPVHWFPLALVGLILFAIGTTLPSAAIFSTASMVGKRSGAGAGISQALLSILASLAAVTGTPLVGLLLERTGSFTTALASVGLIFPALAVTASLFLGFVLKPTLRKSLALNVQ